MARFNCPSCGAPYNGIRCKNCFYEHFTEEIAHGNHSHQGEPLIIDAPVRKPIRPKNPFGCEKKSRKKRPLLRFLIVLLVFNALFPLLIGLWLEMGAREHSFLTAEPEVTIPEAGTILYDDGEVVILTDRQDGDAFDKKIAIFVSNDSDHDLIISAQDVIVNNCMMGSASLYCESPRGRTCSGYLYLNDDALTDAGIQTVEQIDFLLEAWEEDTYETFFNAGPFRLTTAALGANTDTLPQGTALYADDNVTVTCLGYRQDDYYPEILHEGVVLFHIENNTQKYLDIWTPVVRANGEDTSLSFWCQLYPQTRAVCPMYLYDLEDLEISSLDQLEITLEFTDRDDYSTAIVTDELLVDLK